MKRLVVLIGLPGAGKDTQIELLKESKNIEVIKAGDLLRKESKSDPELRRSLEHGDLADNNKVNSVIEKKLLGFKDGCYIISDGFPRRLSQAKWLEDFMANSNIELLKYVLIKISENEAIKRLIKRGRMDDTEETIRHRLDVFKEETTEVIDYYKQKGSLVVVDGMGEIEEINSRIKEALNW